MHKKTTYFNFLSLSSFLGLFLFFFTLLLTNLADGTYTVGELGKTGIKIIQLFGTIGLPLLLLSLGFTYQSRIHTKFEIFSILFRNLFNSLVLFLTALSLGVIPFPTEKIVPTVFPFLTSNYPLLTGLFFVILLFPFLDYLGTKISNRSLILIVFVLFLFSQIALIADHLSALVFLSQIFYPSMVYLFGILLRKISAEKIKVSFVIALLTAVSALFYVFFLRTTLLPFATEKGLLFSTGFINSFLLTPLPVIIGATIVLFYLMVTKYFSAGFKNTSIFLDSLLIAANPLVLLTIKTIFNTMLAEHTRLLSLIGSLSLICIITTFFIFLCSLLNKHFWEDLYDQDISGSSVAWVGYLLVILMNYILNLFMNGFDTEAVFSWYQRSFYLMLLNLVLLAFVYILCLVLFNRFWYGNIFFLVVTLIYGFANYEKILYRNEPITPIDLSNYAALPEIVGMIGIRTVLLLIGLFILLIIAAIVLHRKTKQGKIFRLPVRLFLLIVPIIFLGYVSSVAANFKYGNKENPIAQILEKANFVPHPESLLFNANRNGHLLAFASLTNVKAMREPEDYSQNEIAKLEKKYQDEAVQLNKDRTDAFKNETVIYILSESFSDSSKLPTISLTPDPIPFTRSLMKQTTSGEMFSMGYGGGTANIEFEALTSLSMDNFDPAMTTPYLFVVPKRDHLFTINQLFSKSIAIHPYTAATYRRDQAFEKMKFDAFYHLGNKDYPIKNQEKKDNSKYISDEAVFNETLDHISQSNGDLFIQLTTMQNHMPYNNGTFDNTIKVNGDLTERSKQQVETYSQGIHYSDEALKTFISAINQMDKPVTVVFYGDHLPAIYDGEFLSQKNADTKLHLTDYFIYRNQASQQIIDRKVATPNMFTPMMMAQINQKVSPYYALLTKVSEKLPAMELQKIIDEAGNPISDKDLTKEQRELLNDYRLIQYDITTGKNYLSKDFFAIPK